MQTKTEIKAIIFDLGRVLVKVDLSKGVFRHVEALRRGSDVEIMERLFRDDLYRDFARGMMPFQQFYASQCRHLNLKLDYQEFKRQWCEVLEPMPGMEQLVKELSRTYKIGLLSDIGPIHWNYASKKMSVFQYITHPVLSFQSAVLKPDKRAYELAARAVGQPLSRCLFIDDREENVQGAIVAGMHALQFLSLAQLREELNGRNIL